MSAPSASAPAALLRLPPATVATTTAEVDAFRAAAGGPPGSVPVTFPMRWLAAPEIVAALGSAAGPDEVLVHESQSFAYEAALALDRSYRLDLEAEQTAAPARLVLRGHVTAEDGATCLRLETVLRIVPAPRAIPA